MINELIEKYNIELSSENIDYCELSNKLLTDLININLYNIVDVKLYNIISYVYTYSGNNKLLDHLNSNFSFLGLYPTLMKEYFVEPDKI